MKRAVIFTSATAAGLAGVLAFHTAPVSLAVGGLGASSGGAATNGTGASTTTSSAPPPSTTAPTTSTSPTTTTKRSKKLTAKTPSTTAPTTTTTVRPPAAPPTTTASTSAKTVTGEAVNYYFGVLSVKVTATGKKIDSVTIGQLSDGGNYRSQQLDGMSIPILEQETMQLQNSQIQSVSGASYTSAGFVMSLQSALKKLGI
jgi:uncharacterized protein with FMN-binding domain